MLCRLRVSPLGNVELCFSSLLTWLVQTTGPAGLQRPALPGFLCMQTWTGRQGLRPEFGAQLMSDDGEELAPPEARVVTMPDPLPNVPKLSLGDGQGCRETLRGGHRWG